MADAAKEARAMEIYKGLCDALDARNWHYTKEEDKKIVRYSVNGDDLEMTYLIFVDAERDLLRLVSTMPYKFPEDKRVDGAIVMNATTDGLAHGGFDFDLKTGKINFRLVQTYRDSVVTQELYDYLIDFAVYVVDKYNDVFFAVSKGMMTAAEYLERRYNH